MIGFASQCRRHYDKMKWTKILRRRFEKKNRDLGIQSTRAVEVFTVTAWGHVPDCGQLLKDFPGALHEASNLEALRERLARWREGPT